MTSSTTQSLEETAHSHVVCAFLDALTSAADYDVIERDGELFLIPRGDVELKLAA